MTYFEVQPRVGRVNGIIDRLLDTDLTDAWMKGLKAVPVCSS
jgi:hypothetical protein